MKDRSPGDLFGKDGILSELTKALAERALTTELDEHLGEERAAAPDEGANRSAKTRPPCRIVQLPLRRDLLRSRDAAVLKSCLRQTSRLRLISR